MTRLIGVARASGRLSAAIFLLGFGLVGCAPKRDVVAKVGETQLRVTDYEAALVQRSGGRTGEVDPALLVQEMIDREAGLQKARALGLDQDPAVRRHLANVLLGALAERELTPRLANLGEVDEAELRAAYDARVGEFTRPAKIRVAILRDTGAASPQDLSAMLRLEAAREQFLADKDWATRRGFGAIAVTNSDDPDTRYQGGEFGWLIAGQPSILPSEVVARAWVLKADAPVSEVLMTEQAAYVVRLLERVESAPQPFASVRSVLRAQLLKAREAAVRATYASWLREGIEIETKVEVLAGLDRRTGKTTAVEEAPPALP